MDTMQSFAQKVKKLRTEHKLTQKDFAESIGTTQVTLSSYENGNMNPSLEIVRNIAIKYNVSLNWLCGLSQKKSLQDKITTYSDAFSLLVQLCTTKYIFDDCYFLNMALLDETPGQEDVTFQSCVDINIFTFFKEWDKIYTLYKDGTLDEKFYNMWLEQTLEKYNVPIDGMPDFMH